MLAGTNLEYKGRYILDALVAARRQLALRAREPLGDVRPRVRGLARRAGAMVVDSAGHGAEAAWLVRDRRWLAALRCTV